MESPRLTASGFIKQGTKFGPFHGIIKKTTKQESELVDEKGVHYKLTLDKSKTPASQAWLAQLESTNSGQYNLRIFKENKSFWCKAEIDIEEGQALTAIYQSTSMQEDPETSKDSVKRLCVCQFCHIQFRNPANLQVHIKHYCQKVEISPSDTNLPPGTAEMTSPIEFVCQLCRSTFSNHSNCETHMIKLHSEPESNLCKFCTFIASNIQSLTVHMFQQHVIAHKSRECSLTMAAITTKGNSVDSEIDSKKETDSEINPVTPVITKSVQISTSPSNVVSSLVKIEEHHSSNNSNGILRCTKCSFTTELQLNFDQHHCNQKDNQNNVEDCGNIAKNGTESNVRTIVSEANVSSSTLSDTVGSSQQNLLSCTECNITFKSIRNFSAHKTYYCANRQFANDIYISKLQKRQRNDVDEDEPLQKRTRVYPSPTEHSPEAETTTMSVADPAKQPVHSTMPMLCLSRPTSKESSNFDHQNSADSKPQTTEDSQEKPLDLSVRKNLPLSDKSNESNNVPLVRPTSLNVQTQRAIVLGYKCIECDILFHKQESLKVHKQYYCATRHQPSPQRASPSKNSYRNGSISRNTSRSPISPVLTVEREDSNSPLGKTSPDSVQCGAHRSLPKLSPPTGEIQCPSPHTISQLASSAFKPTRSDHEQHLCSPRQADISSPGIATSPTSSQLGDTPQAGTANHSDDGISKTLVMKCQTTPYHDTMITSNDLQFPIGGLGQRKIYCVCGAVFRNYDIYVAHKETYCSYRNMTSSTVTVIDQAVCHTKNNRIDNAIICNICQSPFPILSELKNHKCVSCVCPVCPFVGSNLTQLQDHFKDHPGLHIDSSIAGTFSINAESIAVAQPSKITREGAKRRKSATPHAIHSKQPKLDKELDRFQARDLQLCDKFIKDTISPQSRQSVITNIKADPETKYIVNSSENQNTEPSNLSKDSSSTATAIPEETTIEEECHEEEFDRENISIKVEPETDVDSPEENEVSSDISNTQTNGCNADEETKLKKISKTNAKLCRTCDLHFNNLSTFIAHRKYYCGASNQVTKTNL